MTYILNAHKQLPPPTTNHWPNLWSWCCGRDTHAVAGQLCWGLLTESAWLGPPASVPAGILRWHQGPPRHRRRLPLCPRTLDLHSTCKSSESHENRNLRWGGPVWVHNTSHLCQGESCSSVTLSHFSLRLCLSSIHLKTETIFHKTDHNQK